MGIYKTYLGGMLANVRMLLFLSSLCVLYYICIPIISLVSIQFK